VAAIDALLEELIKRGGSDLHLAVNQPPLARIRGEIAPLRDGTIAAKELEEMLLELVTVAQRSRLAAELELELAYAYKDIARFRVSYFVKHSGIAAALRAVPLRVPSLAELGCPEILSRLVERRTGLLLVAGPSANGKTTTTAAMVDHVNKTRSCHVLTIENPIEFVHESSRAQVTQREVGTHAPSFTAALRYAARENPDVILVSELSTRDDVELALRLASDGMLVLSNLPVSGVAASLDRLLGLFDPEALPRARNLLSECLTGVVAQHLVRSADAKSRLAVHEILVNTPTVTSLIREGKMASLADAMKSAEGHGMQTLDSALERLLASGKITPEAALERSIDKESFARVVGRIRPELVDPTPASS
jgi:twitching motility protein PilT